MRMRMRMGSGALGGMATELLPLLRYICLLSFESEQRLRIDTIGNNEWVRDGIGVTEYLGFVTANLLILSEQHGVFRDYHGSLDGIPSGGGFYDFHDCDSVDEGGLVWMMT
jgi:hypothetical protein